MVIKEGLLPRPAGPGLGVELNPGVFERKDAVVERTGE